PGGGGGGAQALPPQGLWQERLAQLWQQLLHLPTVSQQQNFFESGGHSLLALQLLTRLRQQWQVDLSLRQVFLHPTLAELASLLDDAGQVAQHRITPASRQQPLPLSFAQQRLWFIAQLDTAAASAYALPIALHLRGQLQRTSLQQALEAMLARHEILRTRFVEVDGQLRQIIDPVIVAGEPDTQAEPDAHAEPADASCTIEFHDIANLAPGPQALALSRLRVAELEQAWDLARASLRVQLIGLGPQEHVLLINQHHIISDGWSLSIWVKELAALYTALHATHGQALPIAALPPALQAPLPLQYADYAAWQRQHGLNDAARQYWMAQLQDAPALLELPLDHPRPARQSYQGASIGFELPAALLQDLRQLAQQHSVSLYMLLLAAWGLVLSRLAGQDQVVIGSPVANRNRHEWEGLLGLFVNTIALRLHLPPEQTLAQLLQQVKATTLAAYEHQDYPFDQVVEALHPQRSLSHSPLFQVMLALNQDAGLQQHRLPELDLSLLPALHTHSHFDLSLVFTEVGSAAVASDNAAPQGLPGVLEYATDLFDASSARRFISLLENLLSSMVQCAPQAHSTRLPDLAWLNSAQQQALLAWGQQNDPAPGDLLALTAFEQQVQQQGDAVALAGCVNWTYRQLDQAANQLAAQLQAALAPQLAGMDNAGSTASTSIATAWQDARIAISCERGPWWVVGILAVWKLGAAYVPLDPHYPAQRLAFMLQDSQPLALLTESSLLPRWHQDLPLFAIDSLLEADPAASASEPASCPASCQPHYLPAVPAARQPNALAYVIYTSGSTGQPKGVMVEHGQLGNLIHAQRQLFGLSPASRVLQFASFSFDASVWELVMALCNGARLVVPGAQEVKQGLAGDALLQLVRQHAVSHATLPSSVLATWPLEGQVPGLTLMIAGEAFPPALASHWAQRQTLFNAYGPTETTVCASVARLLPATPAQSDPAQSGVPPIGRPIANARLYIVNRFQQLQAPGVAGELWIGGAGVARGYLNLPDTTAQRFIADPFVPDQPTARVYRSGDLARWLPDGQIEYLGRNDFQVKIRGFRIEPGEIEARIMQVPGVQEASVQADAKQQSLIAFLVPDPAHRSTPEAQQRLLEAVRQHLQHHLAQYMLPGNWICLSALPLTPNGKIDRASLLQMAASAASAAAQHAASAGAASGSAPIGQHEQDLARIWQSLLGLGQAQMQEQMQEQMQVQREDDFFNLGGHSLLAVQLLARLRSHWFGEAVQSEFGLSDIFQYPQLHAMAQRLQQLQQRQQGQLGMQTTASNPPDQLETEVSPTLLSSAQQRLWFLHQLEPQASQAYHIPLVLRWRGRLNPSAVQAALAHIVERHAVLRSRFVLPAGSSDPVVLAGPWHWQENQWQGSAAELAAYCQAEAEKPFDLSNGPLLRSQLLHLGQMDAMLLLTLHHIITDGWSMGLLLDKFARCYQAFDAGLPDPLPPLRWQYAHYAAWQQRWLSSPAAQQQRQYWQSRLQSAPRLLNLPLDHARPPQQSYRARALEVLIDAPLCADLRALAHQHGCTLYMVLLAGWYLLLARLTEFERGRDDDYDLVIGSVVANRQRAEFEGLIGLFANTLALRLQCAPDASVGQLLTQVKASTLAALAHQDLPFEQVVEAVNPERSVSYSPLFQVLFSLNNTAPMQLPQWDGVQIDNVASQHQSISFDLALSLTDHGQTIAGELKYASDLFNASSIERWRGLWLTLLQQMANQARSASLPLWALPWMAASPAAQVAASAAAPASATHGTAAGASLIHQLFEQQVAQHQERSALRWQQQSLSYAELNRQANRLAHHLIGLGVGPDQIVALCASRGVNMLVALLAIWKSGAAYVPLDPNYPPERLAYMLADSGAVLLISETPLQAQLPQQLPPVFWLDGLDDLANQPLPETNPQPEQMQPNLQPNLQPQHLAYVIYTSGSTGQPKGVMVEHRQIVQLARTLGDLFDIQPRHRVLQFASLSFDASVWEITMALAHGATLVLAGPEQLRPGAELEATLRQHAISHVTLPASALLAWDSEIHFPGLTLIVAGEALPPQLAQQFARRHSMFNAYGPTEATVCASIWHIPANFDASLHARVPIGRALAHANIRLLDHHQQTLPPGVVGEIVIGGAGVARGYLNRPAMTAERFLLDGAQASYRSGDLGRYLADGTLDYLGRVDNQVKIRGFRIELAEIEAQILAFGGIKDVVVLGSDANTPGGQRLLAWLVPQDGAEPGSEQGHEQGNPPAIDLAQLRQHLARHLPDYMLPASYLQLPALPLTANGKLDRRALPQPDQQVQRDWQAPQGAQERLLANLWQDLLQVARVGRNDHFFELGAHSLLAVQLVERLRLQGWALAVKTVFTRPILHELAACLQPAGVAALQDARHAHSLIPDDVSQLGPEPQITPQMLDLVQLEASQLQALAQQVPGGFANIADIYPLSPLQQGIAFHHRLSQQGDSYLLRTVFRFDQPDERQRFISALQHLIARHAILRSAFVWQDLPQTLQVVLRQVNLPQQQLQCKPDQGDALAQLLQATDPQRVRLDIRHAPLMAISLIDSEQGCYLAMLSHHLISDHISLEWLLQDMLAYRQAQSPAAPPPAYRQFIARLQATPAAYHQDWFAAQLAGVEAASLPFDLVPGQASDGLPF
ncbi:MAG: hypothetical protein RL748_356, partial [Pseudomonadota bacterium]